MGAQAEIPSARPMRGFVVHLGEVYLGFVIRRAGGFDAVTLRGELGGFATPEAAARALIAMADFAGGEGE